MTNNEARAACTTFPSNIDSLNQIKRLKTIPQFFNQDLELIKGNFVINWTYVLKSPVAHIGRRYLQRWKNRMGNKKIIETTEVSITNS